ncbi:MAG: DUF2007 domain-containing protein [Gammaproteobacteria bacterium]|nr:DUF2007 domain-containing protein [Gammaproteobacteria bacterium]
MKRIYTHDNIVVLHSAKNVLALNNIESFVKNEHTIPVGARHGISNIFHELWILNDQDYDKASRVIETEIVNPEPKASWICSNCGEENEGSFEVCWKCQDVPLST